ncbi:MAG: Quinoprotein glucose dehydrogenase [Acidobacteria bacterium]|nr:Quinoprotein glucose dehydrogenase [Acidobacteriota bacterium]
MPRKLRAHVLPAASILVVLAWMSAGLVGQVSPTGSDWTTYGGDLASRRYKPFDQINRDTFKDLEIAWRFKTDGLGPRPEFNLQATPLMVGGVIYTPAGSRRAVVALDAATGEMLWMHREDEGKRGDAAPRRLSGRGVAYWTDGRDSRIVYVTPGYQMIALDAKTGQRVPGFGRNGAVDLKLENDQAVDLETGEIGLHSAPIIARDVIVIGAAHLPGGTPKSMTHEKGYIRGYDARTGKRLWIFHTLPRPGEVGNETWERESWAYTGNVGVWAQMTIDEELGMVYLPVELPTGDYYGGHRPGAGLFGESLVALDLKTGQRKWHYQLVHHGIWDFDIPAAPILADITVNGRMIKAIAQPTKQNWLYVFDRVTGQPVWPIEERPVARGDVPGEWYAPTQPFVTKPPAYDLQGVGIDDLIDFTPELRAEATALVSRYRIGPLFTPPPVSTWEGPRGLLMVPSSTGGTNWPGGALDPETNIFYGYSFRNPSVIGMIKDPARSDMNFINGQARDPNAPPPAAGAGGGGEGGGPNVTVQGLPLLKPPYGTISAIDLNKGEIVWQTAHGETPDAIKNHPALKGLSIPRTGRAGGRIGVLVTRTLAIAGEPGFGTTPNGQRGAMLRAYDKATGAEVGAVYMPAPQTGSPMTYMLNGRQYLVVAISGAGYTGELLAFRLPQSAASR